MASDRNADIFAGLILVLSIIALISMLVSDFAGFYLEDYGENRYSCLDCEYATGYDLFTQIMAIILLILQIIIAINDLLPNRLIEKDLTVIGLGLALLTFILVLTGLAAFGAEYDEHEWWPEFSFYAGVVAGLLNSILFFLKYKNEK